MGLLHHLIITFSHAQVCDSPGQAFAAGYPQEVSDDVLRMCVGPAICGSAAVFAPTGKKICHGLVATELEPVQ